MQSQEYGMATNCAMQVIEHMQGQESGAAVNRATRDAGCMQEWDECATVNHAMQGTGYVQGEGDGWISEAIILVGVVPCLMLGLAQSGDGKGCWQSSNQGSLDPTRTRHKKGTNYVQCRPKNHQPRVLRMAGGGSVKPVRLANTTAGYSRGRRPCPGESPGFGGCGK
jgi:hypothetical protein